MEQNVTQSHQWFAAMADLNDTAAQEEAITTAEVILPRLTLKCQHHLHQMLSPDLLQRP